MKRGIWIGLLAVLAFVVIVLARLPASWVIPAANPVASCASIDGSVWNGVCTGLTLGRTSVGDVSFELHPLKLFLGKLAAHLVSRGGVTLTTDIELGLGQSITARNLVGDFPLDPALIPGLPPSVSGRVHLDLALARIEHGIVTQLQGRIEAHDLEERSGRDTLLGSYSITFPAASSGEPTGQLRDLDGPLAVEGTLRLTREPGYDLQGLVAARSNAPQELVNNIRFLGSPDASGRRPFALAGTF